MRKCRVFVWSAVLSSCFLVLAAMSGVARGQSPTNTITSPQVAVVVKFPPYPGLDRAQLEAAMVKSVPIYKNLPKLIRKYYIVADDLSYGGIYLWEDRAAAEAWYTDSPVWKNGVSRSTGLTAEITYLDVPIVIDNQRLQGIDEEQVTVFPEDSVPTVAVVKLPPLTGVTRDQLAAGMYKTVPKYLNLPGLIRKYFIISDQLEFGGIYLWATQSQATAWYTNSVDWNNGVSRTFGERAEITYFDVPLVVDNQGRNSCRETEDEQDHGCPPQSRVP